MKPRWDDDERGRGVAGGERLVAGAEELVEALRAPDWVAESPDAHLLPHLERWCAREGTRLQLDGTELLRDGAFLVHLGWLGEEGQVGAARTAVIGLIGAVAESVTYVRQRDEEGLLTFEVATGMMDGDGDFAPHGHVLLFRLYGVWPDSR